MKNYTLYIVVLLLLCAHGAMAQGGSTEILNLTHSSHVHALGGNNISIVDNDVSLVQHNPALLTSELGGQLGLNYLSYVADISALGAEYAITTSEHSALLAGVQYLDYGDFVQSDAMGTINGSFTAKDMVFNVAFAHDISAHWRGGVNAKYIYSTYYNYSAQAIAIDAGVNYFNKEKMFSLSMVLKNMGGEIQRYGDTPITVPFDVQLGVSKQLAHAPIRISLTAQNLTSWEIATAPLPDSSGNSEATEFSFGENLFRHLIIGCDFMPHPSFYASIGYNYLMRTNMSSYNRNFLSGFSAGAGIRVQMFSVGASYAQHQIGGNTFMFNLTSDLDSLW